MWIEDVYVKGKAGVVSTPEIEAGHVTASIYPNPVCGDYVTIETNFPPGEEFHFSIHNMAGNQIYTGVRNESMLILPVQEYLKSNGMYVFKLIKDNDILVNKLAVHKRENYQLS